MSEERLPQHIGIIMDGNGRWAKEKRRPRSYGHSKAVNNVNEIVEYCFKRGIKMVSLFAFSTENWNRPKNEVDTLFSLLNRYFEKNIKKLLKEGVRLNIMGDISKLPDEVRQKIEKSIEETRQNDDFILNIGINYGGRDEILRAVNILANKGYKTISEADFRRELYTAQFPDPDLVIRTSGEYRLSNFMLYQMAYSELYFTEKYWPDFHANDLEDALQSYFKRNRRYGKIK